MEEWSVGVLEYWEDRHTGRSGDLTQRIEKGMNSAFFQYSTTPILQPPWDSSQVSIY